MRFDQFSYFLDFILCPPLNVYLMLTALRDDGGEGQLIAAVGCGAGLLLWTLVEYCVHRWFFHHAPILRQMHQAHHNAPRAYVASPPALLPLVLVGAAFILFDGLGRQAFASVAVGLLTGYVFYSYVHFATHHVLRARWSYLRDAKHRHMLHHFGAANSNFGVTTGFWDHAFATARGPRRTHLRPQRFKTSG
jgi:sterol desaturase/sphingolipid hydroxylase (fatty acid hydroxylase superfamily)